MKMLVLVLQGIALLPKPRQWWGPHTLGSMTGPVTNRALTQEWGQGHTEMENLGRGCNLVVECLLSMHKALVLSSALEKLNK
jgi:hypothetical protein